jgi:hypothetical protein
MEDCAEPSCAHQPEARRKEVQGGCATFSEAEKRATLREILEGPPSERPDDDDEIVDPTEGWEPVPPTLDELIDWLRSVDRRYESVPWSTRRFWVVEWLDKVNRSYGPFRCLDDLTSALLSVDHKNAFTVLPLLQPDNRPGRPRLTRTEFQNRCMIALAIDALKVAGWSIEESAKAVAARLSKRSVSSIRIRSTTYSSVPVGSWETIKHWREEIVRIARGKGQHRALIRDIAGDYLRQRERVPAVIEARQMDPEVVAVVLLERTRPRSGSGKTLGALLPKAR